MAKNKPVRSPRDLEVSRLVLRDPKTGAIRVVLECVDPVGSINSSHARLAAVAARTVHAEIR